LRGACLCSIAGAAVKQAFLEDKNTPAFLEVLMLAADYIGDYWGSNYAGSFADCM
jgi:hypothetical protein